MRLFILGATVLACTVAVPIHGQGQAHNTVQVTFDDWTVPTPNSFPHDPAFGPGNTLWYSGQASNKLGRVDMASGQFREFDLPRGHGPHGLIADRDGNIWYTANTAGAIAKLDPQTKQVKEYPSPGGTDSQPYGITTTSDGAIWYSESGVEPNTLVRFDPRTEAFQKWNIPSGGGVVRHMVTAPNGELLLAYSGINKIGRVRIR